MPVVGKVKELEGGSHLNKTALILFEDVDVVFEEDEGFYAAVNSLAASTKRPVILTTSNGLFSPRKFLKSDPQVNSLTDCFKRLLNCRCSFKTDQFQLHVIRFQFIDTT